MPSPAVTLQGARPTGSRAYLCVIALIAAMGGLLFGFDTAVISGAVGFLEKQYQLDAMSLGWVVSSALLGCIIGAGFAGALSDRHGRRGMLVLSAILFLLSAVGCVFAAPPGWLALARLVGGLGIGIASMLSPLYIAEFSPPHLRGRLVALYQFAITAGILAAYFSNVYLLKLAAAGAWQTGDFSWWRRILVTEPWRGMLGAEGIPALLFLCFVAWVPESPRWLVEKGGSKRALAILARVSGPAVAAGQLREIEETISAESSSVRQLLEPRWRRPLLIGLVLPVAGQISGINSIIYYGPKIFEAAGFSLGSSFGGSVTVGIILCLATVLAIWKVDTLGRRPLLLAGTAGCVLALLLIALFFHLQITSGPWLLTLVSVFLASFAFSLGPIPWILISEIFPTQIRGRAMSIGTLALWIACAVVSQTFPWLLLHLLPAGTFLLYGCLTAASWLAIWRLVPETKGQSLEQIERGWQRVTRRNSVAPLP